VGYIIGIISSSLSDTGLQISSYEAYLRSIPFHFYAIIMVLFSIAVTVFPFGFQKKYQTGEITDNVSHEGHEQCAFEEKAPPRPWNLIIPLTVLIFSTAFFLWFTGKDSPGTFFQAVFHADFEKAILFSAVLTLLITAIFYLLQKIPLNEIESHFMIGANEMIPPIIILILSWGLSDIVLDLGFRRFIGEIFSNQFPVLLLPALFYLICCAASYFMGSAWGTWALIMPVALPLAAELNINISLMIAAVLAGGSLGDNASPLGETAVLSSTVTGVPIMEHVKSQLPYSLSAVGLSAILFIIAMMVI
jgi:Na+/H+ antiporter NhaC